jgi:ubiquinone/menaquinone biosynthesis C-methylase UbiE
LEISGYLKKLSVINLQEMKRTPEPELMDEIEQAKAYAQADFEQPHQHVIQLFTEKFPDFNPWTTGLDLGCGPCDITIRFVKRYPRLKLQAIDGSSAMLDFAKQYIQKNNVEHRIELIEGLIHEVDTPQDKYDLILSNSLLHHLHNPDQLWSVINKKSQGDTHVFVMDLMRPASEKIAKEMVEQYASDEPEVLKKDFYNSLLASFTTKEVKQQLIDHELNEKLKVEAVSDRHLIIFGKI